jgi:protein phosphatase
MTVKKIENSETVRVDSHGISDRGRQRPTNQDQFMIAGLNRGMLVKQTSLDLADQTQLNGELKGQLLLVADGMGGLSDGDEASELAVRTVTSYVLNTMSWFLSLDPRREDDLVDDLSAALGRCEARLRPDEEASAPRRMGTTLTMAYVLWPRLYVVHAGDTRCYLFRGGALKQLTEDHSVAQQLVERGAMDEEDAEASRFSHVLYNAIVSDDSAELNPAVYKATIEDGDALLLCSDGLNKHVPDPHLTAVLDAGLPAADTAQRLIDAANEDGGTDNITVVVVRFAGGAPPA